MLHTFIPLYTLTVHNLLTAKTPWSVFQDGWETDGWTKCIYLYTKRSDRHSFDCNDYFSFLSHIVESIMNIQRYLISYSSSFPYFSLSPQSAFQRSLTVLILYRPHHYNIRLRVQILLICVAISHNTTQSQVSAVLPFQGLSPALVSLQTVHWQMDAEQKREITTHMIRCRHIGASHSQLWVSA